MLAAIARSRKLLKNRALVAAVAGAIPLPGLDWAAQAALLSRVLPKINAEFGLTPQQLDELSPEKRESVQNAVTVVGSALIGKFITREMVLRLAKLVGGVAVIQDPLHTLVISVPLHTLRICPEHVDR